MAVFERDLIEAEKEIVISSPRLVQAKIDRLIYLMKPRQEAGIKVTVLTESPEMDPYGNADYTYALIRHMGECGIAVKVEEKEIEHFAVIDQILVWHGGMNLLGEEDAYDNLIRVMDEKAAGELLGMAFGEEKK